MSELEPGTERLMHISSELLSAQDQIRRQQRTIFGLMSILHAERLASARMCELLEALLTGEG